MRIAKLGELTKIKTGKLDANASVEGGRYPFFTCSIDPLRIDSYSYDCECVLLAGNGDLNVKYYEGRFDAYQRTYIIESEDRCSLDTRYLYYFLTQYVQQLRDSSIGAVIKYIKKGDLTEAVIPLPEITIQKRIICNLDLVIKLLDKEKKKEKYFDELVKSRFVEMFGDPISSLKYSRCLIGDLAVVSSGATPSRKKPEYYEGTIPWVKTGEVAAGNIDETEECITEAAIRDSACRILPAGTILIAMYGQGDTRGKSAILNIEAATNQACAALEFKDEIDARFALTFLQLCYDDLRNLSQGGNQKNLNLKIIKEYSMLTPPVYLQKEFANFVAQVDKLKFDLGICLFILREETFRLSG